MFYIPIGDVNEVEIDPTLKFIFNVGYHQKIKQFTLNCVEGYSVIVDENVNQVFSHFSNKIISYYNLFKHKRLVMPITLVSQMCNWSSGVEHYIKLKPRG